MMNEAQKLIDWYNSLPLDLKRYLADKVLRSFAFATPPIIYNLDQPLDPQLYSAINDETLIEFVEIGIHFWLVKEPDMFIEKSIQEQWLSLFPEVLEY